MEALLKRPVSKDILKVYRKAIEKERGREVLNFVEEYLDLSELLDIAVVDTGSHVNLTNFHSLHNLIDEGLGGIVNIKRINDMQYINKFLEASNKRLRTGGYFVGCVETSSNRKYRILKKGIVPFNYLRYFIDFMFKRAAPKVPVAKKIYFFITHGRNRVISEIETYGRLYSCGFRLIESKVINNQLWFIGEKVKDPDYNHKATYGPLIRLRRVGKNGKVFNVYKMRTMHPYSEYLQPYINEKYGLQKGGKFANDPRITTLGRIFRKFWLDELPMIINLMKGDIKLVGVRPLSKHYFELYPVHVQKLRTTTKPGLLPPFYADLPETLDEIVASEERYLKYYKRYGFLADIVYFWKIFKNIVFKRARSN
jgi:lipopolysaccharide/colanic/teichoic acid biosynthesis glycosyltransferase